MRTTDQIQKDVQAALDSYEKRKRDLAAKIDTAKAEIEKSKADKEKFLIAGNMEAHQKAAFDEQRALHELQRLQSISISAPYDEKRSVEIEKEYKASALAEVEPLLCEYREKLEEVESVKRKIHEAVGIDGYDFSMLLNRCGYTPKWNPLTRCCVKAEVAGQLIEIAEKVKGKYPKDRLFNEIV